MVPVAIARLHVNAVKRSPLKSLTGGSYVFPTNTAFAKLLQPGWCDVGRCDVFVLRARDRDRAWPYAARNFLYRAIDSLITVVRMESNRRQGGGEKCVESAFHEHRPSNIVDSLLAICSELAWQWRLLEDPQYYLLPCGHTFFPAAP